MVNDHNRVLLLALRLLQCTAYLLLFLFTVFHIITEGSQSILIRTTQRISNKYESVSAL
jgi:hypothetical protein